MNRVAPSPGIHRGVAFAEYLAWDAWSNSDLKAMRGGPAAMVPWRRENPSPETDATRLGTAAHCAILEPDRFAATYEEKPEGIKFSSLQGKAWRDDPCRAGKVLLSPNEWAQVQNIIAAFNGKAIALASLATCVEREASIAWTCPVTKQLCKARPDWYGEQYLYDLKISRHAAEAWLEARAQAEGWMHQLAHYRAGLRVLGVPIVTGRLVVIGPKEPQQHRVYCIEAKESYLDLLEIENENTLRRLAECQASNVWPGTHDEWRKVEPPASELAKGIELVGAIDLEE